jgi:hypothetical protein
VCVASFVSIFRVDAIAFCVSKTIVSEWRSSSSWFRTQALGQSNFLPFDFGLFFILISSMVVLLVLDLRFLMFFSRA